MVQYSGNNKNPPTTTLKSLKDPYDDNLSLGSQRWVLTLQSQFVKLIKHFFPQPDRKRLPRWITDAGLVLCSTEATGLQMQSRRVLGHHGALRTRHLTNGSATHSLLLNDRLRLAIMTNRQLIEKSRNISGANETRRLKMIWIDQRESTCVE